MRGRRQLGLVVLSVGVTLMLLAGCAPCSVLPIPGTGPQIQLWAEHEAVPPGGCTTLHWQVSSGEQYPVFLNGSEVASEGQQEVCPEQTQTFELVVGAPGGSVSQTVTVEVQGGAPGPAPTSKPPAATTAPPPPPAATSAPPPPPAATSAPPPPPAATSTPPPPAPTATPKPPTPTATAFVPVWGQCSWVPVEQGGINSHQEATWCSNGSFLTGLDLDEGAAGIDPMDSPVVGAAQCCPLSAAQFSPWGQCTWKPYGDAGAASHQHQPLCPNGQYLTGLNLDQLGGADPLDSPVVGEGFCCPFGDPNKYLAWGSCDWVPVEQGGINSHQPVTWCPNGSFLAGLDLDQGPVGIDPLDSPVVGQAYCCNPKL